MLSRSRRLPKAAFTKPPIRRARFSFGAVAYLSYVPIGVAVVVSKKTARLAVDRNRIRRRLYSAVRAVLKPGTLNASIVFYPTREVLTTDFEALKVSIRSLF